MSIEPADKLQFNEENLNRIRYLPYVFDRFSYQRRKTREVKVGDLGIGGANPVRVQTMTISDTQNIAATIDEAERLAKAGAELVRITAPSQKDAECLKDIREGLFKRGCRVPLCADIHFTPKAALLACEYVEKVRINPGNFADKKVFGQRNYTDQEYREELERVEEKFSPLVLRAKELGRALRIGTNHGSLADRIMNQYGDTPLGMVESALEFVEICRRHHFHDLIISMKASNPKVMIQAYRLLAARMDQLIYDYPIHLGVTEAGAGEDGRIKSAVGIGSLLEDGIGDTIRVSLTEDSIHEIPVCYELIRRYSPQSKERIAEKPAVNLPTHEERSADFQFLKMEKGFSPYYYQRRQTETSSFGTWSLGGEETTRVQVELSKHDPAEALKELKDLVGVPRDFDPAQHSLSPDSLPDQLRAEIIEIPFSTGHSVSFNKIVAQTRPLLEAIRQAGTSISLAFATAQMAPEIFPQTKPGDVLKLGFENGEESEDAWIQKATAFLKQAKSHGLKIQWALHEEHCPAWIVDKWGPAPDSFALAMLFAVNLARELGLKETMAGFAMKNPVAAYRLLSHQLHSRDLVIPLVLFEPLSCALTEAELRGAAVIGSLLCDGIGDVIALSAGKRQARNSVRFAYNVLQATGNRISKTEFISCPSCGRTLFNLEETTERIRRQMGHLKGLKLAIMGCIVNGPGEMADAHFGYVGAGPGRINLYVGKECVQKNIPSAEADQRLIDLVREHGLWRDAKSA